ncbi:endolytic transglycosylase MltG [Pelagerythrobacter rhizovicinus]|uniref:Endolytic murein transglycosylase n=1 Tax=Pelagerythrobacter rhizovicinus TaxID=2268576 RepID=A0A4Q2KPA4_9SPHN|nr:endolytic transglycosylase MltG [Pelagerythrobacter rhizovicinus]RXZ66419.1 endolytic transglycosylase MltG [Pelagerythrobacter rhizovicinus]
MRRRGCIVAGALAALALLTAVVFGSLAFGSAQVQKDTAFIVPSGATLTAVAHKLENEGLITSADGFLLRAKLLGSSDPIQAGEFRLPAGIGQGGILDTFQHGEVIRRFITIPEGMPSILVYEKLMAEPLLTGEIPVPEEGSVLPDTYAFERGEARTAVLARMQAAMRNYLAEAWPKRGEDIAVDTIEEAVTLASIVEKETALPKERRMVAGLYSNRVKDGMFLQADPTIIYPITKGKPLGRRIRQSEIAAINDYNTYSMAGLPKGPITNPGRESIAAVLNPAKTDALYMVADGTGGHVFNSDYAAHQEAVDKWFAIRRARGEM